MIRSQDVVRGLACSIVLLLAAPALAQEKLPPGAKVAKVEVRPDKIELKHAFDYRQLLVTGILENGDRIDLTRMAQFTVPDKVVKISERGLLRPVADGQGALKIA